ncbi:MAG: hypothetical protein ACKVHE_01575 [Planctomycetales bacterium]|jgi:hypothetical protein
MPDSTTPDDQLDDQSADSQSDFAADTSPELDPSHPTNEMNFRGNCGHNEAS